MQAKTPDFFMTKEHAARLQRFFAGKIQSFVHADPESCQQNHRIFFGDSIGGIPIDHPFEEESFRAILVGGNWLPSIWHFPINIGFLSSSQLTKSYFSGRGG